MQGMGADLYSFLTRHKLFWLASGILLLLYWPVLTGVYGFHNDYAMLFDFTLLSEGKPGWFRFNESNNLFIVGRPVLAFLMNVVAHTVTNAESFMTWRFIGFGFMLGFFAVIWQVLVCALGVEQFWAAMAILFMGLLPGMILGVIWLTMIPADGFNFLLISAAWVCLEMACAKAVWFRRDMPAIFWAVGAMLLFLVALYNYPLTAMGVFFFYFLRVLFARDVIWPEMRRRMVVGVAFWGMGMLIYRLTERYLVTPAFMKGIHFNDVMSLYDLNIGFDLKPKMLLLGKILTVMVAGPWEFLSWTTLAWIGPLVVIALALGGLGWQRRAAFDAKMFRMVGERLAWGITFILFMLCPLLLGKGVSFFNGYRVVALLGCAFVMILVAILRLASTEPRYMRWAKGLGVGMSLSAVLVVSSALGVALKHNEQQLDFIRAKLAQADLRIKKKFVLIRLPDDASWVNRTGKGEFLMGMVTGQQLQPLVDEAFTKRKLSPDGVVSFVLESQYRGRVIPKEDVLIMDPAELIYWR